MDSTGLGRAMGDAIVALIVMCLLGGAIVGACGTCVAQKAAGYRIRIEKVGGEP